MKALLSRLSPKLVRGETQGAVYVEMLIAFLPVFTFFLCILQLALLFATQIFVEHTATTAARACGLVLGEPPPDWIKKHEQYSKNASWGDFSFMGNVKTPLSDTLLDPRLLIVRRAAVLTLAPLIIDGTVERVHLEFPSLPGGPNDLLQQYPPLSSDTVGVARVRVKALVNCKVVIANQIACGQMLDPTKWLEAEGVFPIMKTEYSPSTKCGEEKK